MILKRLLARAALLAAAASLVMATGATAQAPSGPPIKIGSSMAMTGGLGPNGKSALLAWKIWEEEVNAKGGLRGRPVKLIYYDDQSNPSTVPGIYTKLLDIDKVDLVVGGYATAMLAPAMPVIMQHKKTFIGLLGLAVNSEFHYPNYFVMIPSGPNPKPAFTEGFFEVAMAQNPKPQTVALAMADAEFSQNACDGARENAKKAGLKIVYDKAYPPPPKTTDFTPVVRALQAANADLVVVCSYPADSVGIVESANEIGLKPKMFGGAMVGLQTTVFKDKLKGKLNGIVNYETWVPDEREMYKGTKEFFAEYQKRAKSAGVDPLGYYLGGWGYAQFQILGDAIKGSNSINDDKIADYLKKTKFETIMGPVKYGAKGEWAEGRMLQVQYHDIKPDANLETWRGMSYQTVLTPKNLSTGAVVYPYEKAHQ
jgi:branched-chain amino acid transport system substrate-binding protein